MKRLRATAVLLLLLHCSLHAQRVGSVLKVQNLSTGNRSQVFIQWETPSCPNWTSSNIERSMADSTWMQLAVRPSPVRCMLDTTVKRDVAYRYRVQCDCVTGESQTWYSDALRVDEITHFDLHEYFLPERWRTLEYTVTETEQRDNRRCDTTYHVAWRFFRAEPNRSGGEDELFEVTSQIEQGLPETTYVRFTTEFADRILFYSDTSLLWLGVPTVWKKRSVLFPGTPPLAMQDSARYIPLPVNTLSEPDTLIVVFESGFSWSSDFRFRRGFGLLQAYYDISGMLSQTFHHAYRISLSSPLSVPAEHSVATGIEVDLFPNPFRTDVSLLVQVARSAPILLTLHDILGRTVATLKDGPCEVGRYAFTFQAADLPSGMYICRLQSRSTVITRSILRMR